MKSKIFLIPVLLAAMALHAAYVYEEPYQEETVESSGTEPRFVPNDEYLYGAYPGELEESDTAGYVTPEPEEEEVPDGGTFPVEPDIIEEPEEERYGYAGTQPDFDDPGEYEELPDEERYAGIEPEPAEEEPLYVY